jgi:inhibitor of the pro-sigma K processing machinery
MPSLPSDLPGLGVLAAYLAGALAVFILLRWLGRPLLWLGAGVYRLVLGGAAIWALDALARPVGLHVALNPASALTVGILGIPGLALLLVFGGLVP